MHSPDKRDDAAAGPQRRGFLKQLAAGAGAASFLAALADADAADLRRFGEELGGLRDERARWSRVRREFLINPGLTYLNCGTIGLCPQRVLDTVCEHLRHVEKDPFEHAFGAPVDIAAKAAEFIGATRDEVAVMRNTTEGMNAVATALKLKSGDEILTTNHEHSGGMICWQHLAREFGARVVCVDLPAPVADKAQLLDRITSRITGRTRVCSLSHVDTLTGCVMPLADIAQITRPKGILLVCDGAQVPGMMNVDVKALGVDTYASSSHKWMLAPKGNGLLYVRKEIQKQVPLVSQFSGYGQAAYSGSGGTQNVAGLLGHAAAMDFHNAIGRNQVEARCRQLNIQMRRRLDALPGLTLLSPSWPDLSAAGIVTYALKKGNSNAIGDQLYFEHGIRVKVVPSTYAAVAPETGKPHDYNALRISTHIFNSEADVDRLADALKGMV